MYFFLCVHSVNFNPSFIRVRPPWGASGCRDFESLKIFYRADPKFEVFFGIGYILVPLYGILPILVMDNERILETDDTPQPTQNLRDSKSLYILRNFNIA